MMKRLLSLLLAGILIFSLVPAQVLATDGAEDAAPSEEATVPTVMLMTDPVNSSDGDDTDPSEQAEAEPTEATKPIRMVTFDSNGGSAVAPDNVLDGSTVDRPKDPEKDGFIFGGWYHGDTLWDFDDAVTEDIDLTAKWLEAVTVTFDTDGGSEVKSAPVVKGSTVEEPEAPEKTNCIFSGWYADEALTTKWNFDADKVDTDTILYAKWTLKVIFNSNGGSDIPVQGVELGGKIAKPEDPTLKDFEFGGWYKDDQFTTAWDFEKDTVEGTTILYAKWNVIVSFDSKRGSAVASQTLNIGDKVTRPTDPTRNNCTFVAWYKDPTLNTPWSFESDTVSKNTKLYAKWNTTVTFVSNGGSDVESQTVAVGTLATQPTVPTKANLEFGGWYKETALTNKWDFGSDTVTTPNLKLYAKWNVTVSFDTDGGTAVTDQTVAENSKITQIPVSTKEGFALEGWYKDEALTEAWNFATDTFTENITLYAKWEEAVNVIFDKKNGTAHDIVPVGIGKTVSKPEDPEKYDHEFAGWYKDENCTDPWDFKTEVTQSITLYAKWLELFDVTFNSNGGSKVSADEVTKGSTVTEPAAPTRNNYVFGGWYKEAALTNPWDFKTDTVAGNTILYAKWNLKVIFDTDGGSSVPVQGVEKDGKVTEPEKDPTKKDFVFGGWYDEYGKEWDFEKNTINGTTTIYAKWMVEVTFDSKDGSAVDPDTVILDIGDLVEEPDDPVKSNNVFKGWYNGSSKWDFEEDTVSKNTTLTAKWEANPLVIKISATNVYPGDAPTFTVTLNGKTDSTLDIDWSVSGNTDEDTDISDTGVLTIGENEEAETLTVTAETGTYSSEFYVTLRPTYDFKSGSGGKWAQKSTKSLTFECNGPMDEIKDIKIGTTAVSTTNYTIEESSYGFKLTLKSAAMSSLSVAEHKLTITFDDGGKAETTFEVIKESDIPETGDFFHLPLWCTLLAVTAAAALMLKKRQA